MPDRILVWGASGHAKVVSEIIRLRGLGEVAGFLDDVSPERVGEPFCGARVVGSLADVPRLCRELDAHAVALAVGDCAARLRAARQLRDSGMRLVTAVHPSAIVSPSARIEDGAVVAAGAIVNPDARVGLGAIVNTAASVDHDCVVGDGAHISPGARLGGWVRVGAGAWIGIGASVLPRVTIGDGAVLGAAALALGDIPPHAVAYGVPARVSRRNPT